MTERLGRYWAMLTGAHAGVLSSSILLMGGVLSSSCSQAPHEQVHPTQADTTAAPSYQASANDGGSEAEPTGLSRAGNESAGNYSGSDDDSEIDESTETDTGNPVDSQVDPVNRAASSGAGAYAQYIAFGDSFASGFGLSGAGTNTCAQSQQAWPLRVNNDLGITRPIHFVACSGAKTPDVFASLSLEQTAELTQPKAGGQPISTLITIQIGGNDLKLGDSIQECGEGLKALKESTKLAESLTALTQLSPRCASLDWLLKNFNTFVQQSLPANLDNTFRSLRAAAPDATIIAVGYPHLVNATSSCSGLWRLLPTTYRQRMNDLADAINLQIYNAAKKAGLLSLTSEVVTAFQGREACSAKAMINTFHLHPNAAGHQAYAKLVARLVAGARIRTVTEPEDGPTEPGTSVDAVSDREEEEPSGKDSEEEEEEEEEEL